MTYDAAFFTDNRPIAISAAEVVLPDVLKRTGARNVIDIGCGQGAWLSVAKAHGAAVHGVDGNAPDDQLMIEPSEFQRWDLSGDFAFSNYDLAICLEVAEHLPESSAQGLVFTLCLAPYVLFSGAHPGQGGVNHINEQWSTWWAALFGVWGYLPSVDIRWQHWNDQRVQDFYRENMIVFAKPADLERAGYRVGVFDVIHPVRTGRWPS